MLKITILTLASVVGAALLSVPQEESAGAVTPDEAAETEIEDFAWLAGAWRGTGLGGQCEEIWSEPMAGTMVGTFRLVQGGKIVFYEILLLSKDEKGFSLRVKHFSDRFVAWEDKGESIRFALESVKPNEAVFSGLKMKRTGDKLDLSLRMRSADGESTWRSLEFEREVLGDPAPKPDSPR